jgi:hypothetical protein
MKVFVPMSDSVVDDQNWGKLVPFNPGYLVERSSCDQPSNWITEDDYLSACKRLEESQPVSA